MPEYDKNFNPIPPEKSAFTSGASKAVGFILAIAIFLVLFAALIFVEGFVLMTVWNWFAPAAFGLAPITLPLALGVSVLKAAFFVSENATINKVKNDNGFIMKALNPAAAAKSEAKYLGTIFLSYLMILGFGYVFHLFI